MIYGELILASGSSILVDTGEKNEQSEYWWNYILPASKLYILYSPHGSKDSANTCTINLQYTLKKVMKMDMTIWLK